MPLPHETAAAFTTDDLVVATTAVRGEGDRFLLRVPEGWRQGRGAFGGLVLAALARAIETCEADPERVLRSISGQLIGPVLAGEAVIEVRLLRSGSAVSTWSASLTQQGETLAVATAVHGRARRIEQASWAPAPPAFDPPWSSIEVAPVQAPLGPEFAGHLEYRLTGPLPFSSAPEAIASGWVRSKKLLPRLGAPELIAYADAWWPAMLATEQAPRPTATVAFTLQLFTPSRPLDPSRPLYHRAHAVAGQEGYAVELRELWSEQGELVALNQQTFVTIK
jgi:acyl-CoA thioesterase